MLSRAIRLEDILLVRAPPVEFLAKAPPEGLTNALETFAGRTASCRKQALQLADELGLRHLLRDND